MIRVLVTGAAGYVGRQVAARLSESVHVVGVDVAERPVPFELVRMDVRDRGLADVVADRSITHVVHLAAILEGAERERAFDIDVNGTANVIAACVSAGVGHLTVTSSGAAYGYRADNPVPIDEDAPLRAGPSFPYADHKRQVEELLARARSDHPALGQLVLRVGTVLGATTENLITDLFSRRLIPTVAGHSAPFVFIWDQDLVSIIETGVAHGRTGIFNVAGDGALTIREVARALGAVAVPVPAGVLTTVLAIMRAAGVGRYGPEQVDFLRHRPVLDNTRLKTEFGYVPSKTSREALLSFAHRTETS